MQSYKQIRLCANIIFTFFAIVNVTAVFAFTFILAIAPNFEIALPLVILADLLALAILMFGAYLLRALLRGFADLIENSFDIKDSLIENEE